MKAFGYLAHRIAVCEGCGRRLPTESDPVIVWGHSLDGLDYAPYCEACVRKLRVTVVERVVVGEQWCPRPPHLCSDCGRRLPAPDDGGWVLGALTSAGLVCLCNDCRLRRGLPTAATFRSRSSDEPARVAVEMARRVGHAEPLLVGVLSDTHGKLDPAILVLFAACDHIVHAGDVGEQAILERLRAVAPLTAVCGNCDGGSVPGLPESATMTLEGVTVLIRHDLKMVEALDAPVLGAMRQAGSGVVICGHTHLSAVERRDGVLYLNPGSAGLRRDESPRSVALLRVERRQCQAEIRELGWDVLV